MGEQQSAMDAAGDLERGDAGGGRWPEGPARFRWSRQTGRIRVFLHNNLQQLTLEEAERALDELTRCVAAVREWESRS